jgi:DNA ligase-associated metallophosphoesterase
MAMDGIDDLILTAENLPSGDAPAGASRAVGWMVNGVQVLADCSGALSVPSQRLLVVADLHLEKGSSFARHGLHLPPYDTRTTLERLAEVLRRVDPDQVLCLGDSFHDQAGPTRLDERDRATLETLIRGRRWIWSAGNHDPAPPAGLGGASHGGDLTLGALTFRHEAAEHFGAGEISGHYHPKASIQIHGRRLTCRCFVGDGKRLILPAFGAYAGGLDVFDPAITRLFPRGFTVGMVGKTRITALPAKRLREG